MEGEEISKPREKLEKAFVPGKRLYPQQRSVMNFCLVSTFRGRRPVYPLSVVAACLS